MYFYSKRKFLLLVLVALSTSLVIVPISYASIGVKEGDWAKYEVTATAIEGSEDLLDDLGDLDLDWFRIEVKNVSSNIVYLELIVHQLDGTEITDTIEAHDLGFIVEANLKEGDPIIAPLIGEATYFNGTISQEYAGISRDINYIDLSTVDLFDVNYRSYFDQQTGIMCEVSVSFTMDVSEEHYEATVTYKLIETNMFQSSSLMDAWWFYPAIGIVGVAAVVVILVFRRSRSTKPLPGPATNF